MKYKMVADESFTDKLDETIEYMPGDMIKTKVDEKRKDDMVARKLAHVVEEIDTTDKAKKEAEKKAAEEKKKAEEEARKLAEEAAKKEAEKNNENEGKPADPSTGDE